MDTPRVATLSQEAELTTLGAFAADHGLALTRFAYLLCGDPGLAEDLVQDTYLALHRKYGVTLPLEAPVAYTRRAIVNAFISRARRRSSLELATAELPDRALDLPSPDERDAMWRALAALPERQRTVLVLRYYLDLADRDIANLMDAGEGTVRSLASRAFAALRQHPALNPQSAEDQR